MNAMERRVARLESVANISKINVGAELMALIAERRAAIRRGDWVEPSREEKVARLRASLQEPMSAEARELTERLICVHEARQAKGKENRS